MNVSEKDLQSTNATILMVDILIKLSFAPFFGILSDKFGRQLVLMYGIITASLGFALMAFCSEVYS
jgi:MFS family permease